MELLYKCANQQFRFLQISRRDIADSSRQYTGEYVHFLSIAFGSCGELETQILLAKDIGFLKNNDFEIVYNLCQEVSKMLNSLIISLKKDHGE